jgi:hypothetical protein
MAVSERQMPGFTPVERDEKGRLVAEHEETGWTIAARDEQVLKRLAGVIRCAARLRVE